MGDIPSWMGNFWQLARQKLGTEVLPRPKPYMKAFSGESFSKLISVEFRGIFLLWGSHSMRTDWQGLKVNPLIIIRWSGAEVHSVCLPKKKYDNKKSLFDHISGVRKGWVKQTKIKYFPCPLPFGLSRLGI